MSAIATKPKESNLKCGLCARKLVILAEVTSKNRYSVPVCPRCDGPLPALEK